MHPKCRLGNFPYSVRNKALLLLGRDGKIPFRSQHRRCTHMQIGSQVGKTDVGREEDGGGEGQ